MLEITRLPDWFRQTSAGRAILDEHAASVERDRQAVAATIAKARRRLDKEMPPLAARRAAAGDVVAETRRAHEGALQAYHVADGAVRSLSFAIEHEVSVGEAMLRATADPRIAAFRTALLDRIDHVRYSRGSGHANKAQALATMREVLPELDALMLETGTDVAVRLAGFEQRIQAAVESAAVGASA